MGKIYGLLLLVICVAAVCARNGRHNNRAGKSDCKDSPDCKAALDLCSSLTKSDKHGCMVLYHEECCPRDHGHKDDDGGANKHSKKSVKGKMSASSHKSVTEKPKWQDRMERARRERNERRHRQRGGMH